MPTTSRVDDPAALQADIAEKRRQREEERKREAAEREAELKRREEERQARMAARKAARYGFVRLGFIWFLLNLLNE